MQSMLDVRASGIEYVRHAIRVETVLGLGSVRVVGSKVLADLLTY